MIACTVSRKILVLVKDNQKTPFKFWFSVYDSKDQIMQMIFDFYIIVKCHYLDYNSPQSSA